MKIEGLDKITKELDQFTKAVAELDGELTTVSYNPEDPESIEQAISQMEAALDEKAASFTSNEFVMSVVEDMKEQYREAILEQAAAARLEGNSGEEE